MMTKLKVYKLAYAELLRKWNEERKCKEGIIHQHRIASLSKEISILHRLILIMERAEHTKA